MWARPWAQESIGEGFTQGVVFRFTFQTGHSEWDEWDKRQVKGGQGRRPGYARK